MSAPERPERKTSTTDKPDNAGLNVLHNLMFGQDDGNDTPTSGPSRCETPQTPRSGRSRSGTPQHGTPQPGTPQHGTPVLHRPPRATTPSTCPVSPARDSYLGGGSAPGSRTGSRRQSTSSDAELGRRGSVNPKRAFRDMRKGVLNVTESTLQAGLKMVDTTINSSQLLREDLSEAKQKVVESSKETSKQLNQFKNDAQATGRMVKDKTAHVGGNIKDATQGAGKWMASKSAETAKAAMEQAKSGLSFGEKFMLVASESISKWSRSGFTHVMLFFILAGYTALGAALYIALEGPHEVATNDQYREDKILFQAELEQAKIEFVKELWNIKEVPLNDTEWEEQTRDLLTTYDAYVEKLAIAPEPAANETEYVWTFWKAMFFCSTVTTTIGYGHISPSTTAGQSLTIVYAILGIPIFLILMADFGKLFTRLLKSLFVFFRRLYRSATCRRVRNTPQIQTGLRRMRECWAYVCCGKIQEDEEADEPHGDFMDVDDNFNLPISLALLILLIYIFVGCIIYTFWESWTYFEAFYFIFISMTTIGFGDYVPEDHKRVCN